MFKKLFYHIKSNGFQAYNTKMVLIVRTDLKMERGKVAAQCAHAAVISYQQALDSTETQSKLAKLWYHKGQPKIVLKIDSESTLQELYKSALNCNLNAVLVHDAGHTQVKHGTVTVLGIGPNEKHLIDNVASHLKLY